MDRYDRQVRLWSESGQESLRTSHVLAVGQSWALAETLKNLVLAGIGELTLHEYELKTNRFYNFHELNAETKINKATSSKVDLVLMAAHMGQSRFNSLRELNVPILIVGSCMMKACLTVDVNKNTLFVLQPHPPAGLVDLRFKQLWPELQALCDASDLNAISETEHRHVPYAILLAKAAASHEDVKESLKRMRKYADEENFDEAQRNVYRVYAPSVPEGVRELLQEVKSMKDDDLKHPFWQHVVALNKFVDEHNCLPVSGEIPDMVSSSDVYTELRDVYRSKARDDLETFRSYLDALEEEKFTQTFVKNSRFVRVITAPEIEDPYNEIKEEFKQLPLRELVSVSSFIGGVSAQEATKILMSQYTPMVSMLEYDAMTQKTDIYKFPGIRIIN